MPGLTSAGSDLHIVVGDLLDAPDLGTQGEGVADAPFPDKLFVQFAYLGLGILHPQDHNSPGPEWSRPAR